MGFGLFCDDSVLFVSLTRVTLLRTVLDCLFSARSEITALPFCMLDCHLDCFANGV